MFPPPSPIVNLTALESSSSIYGRYYGVWERLAVTIVPTILGKEQSTGPEFCEELDSHLLLASLALFGHWDTLVPATELEQSSLVLSLRTCCTELLKQILQLSETKLERFARLINFFVTSGR